MFKLRALFTIFFLVLCQSLMAFSIGKDGDPIIKNQISWQPVKFEGDESGFTALLPGKTVSGMKNSTVYAGSMFEGVTYIVFTDAFGHYRCPASEKRFLKQTEEAFKDNKRVKITSRRSNQRHVRYMAEVNNPDTGEIILILCSHNHLYYASILPEGSKCRLLKDDFFNSIIITK